jgi:hypothetical protein
MNRTHLEEATVRAYKLLENVEGDVLRLAEPVQTLVLVDSSQGIIDNGGLEYLFENDFPGNAPYSLLVEAFRRVGAEAVASCIEKSSLMFPFAQPHLFPVKRQHWMDSIKGDDTHEFARLSRMACGDETVFQHLASYGENNREAFGV